jgi:hypothetical protein
VQQQEQALQGVVSQGLPSSTSSSTCVTPALYNVLKPRQPAQEVRSLAVVVVLLMVAEVPLLSLVCPTV